MRLALVIGTRPEIVKMSPIIRLCKEKKIDYFMIHTGQHYDFNMDGAFFNDLQLPTPNYNLRVGSGGHAEQTAKILVGVEKILVKEKPDVTLVEGDTNSVLGGALVASKLHMKLGHVEAGLRSGDPGMPEEVNRIIADHVSDYLFAPTDVSKTNLLREGLDRQVYVTGNTVVDALKENIKIAGNKEVLEVRNLSPMEYFLVTLHRVENVNDRTRLTEILSALSAIKKKYSLPMVFPVHPRTRKIIDGFGLSTDGLTLVEPLPYLEFIQLESQAKLILTDSGGVQEEACSLGVPCVTIRENTERPETVDVGANIVAGIKSNGIIECTDIMLKANKGWLNPYGDGSAGLKIINILRTEFG